MFLLVVTFSDITYSSTQSFLNSFKKDYAKQIVKIIDIVCCEITLMIIMHE